MLPQKCICRKKIHNISGLQERKILYVNCTCICIYQKNNEKKNPSCIENLNRDLKYLTILFHKIGLIVCPKIFMPHI